MEKKKIYYYDEKNDLTEYIEGSPDIPMTVAHWVNPYLTLLFDIECEECTIDNIVGFQINEIRHLFHKAEEQASIPLTPEQEKRNE